MQIELVLIVKSIFNVGPAAELKKYLEVQIVFFQMAKCISPYCKMYLDINF